MPRRRTLPGASASDDSFGAGQYGAGLHRAAIADGQLSIRDALVVEGDSGTTAADLHRRSRRRHRRDRRTSTMRSLRHRRRRRSRRGRGAQRHRELRAGRPGEAIAIPVAGDTVASPTRRFTVDALERDRRDAMADATATGTIVNDDPLRSPTYEIQGEGHRSAYAGQTVTTGGIVTASTPTASTSRTRSATATPPRRTACSSSPARRHRHGDRRRGARERHGAGISPGNDAANLTIA